METRNLGKIILLRLRRLGELDISEYTTPKIKEKYKTPLAMLIATILSQNTNDKNAIKAFNNLVKTLGGKITIESILNTPLERIREAIRVAGMYNKRAKTIKEVAFYIKSRLGGSLEDILSLPLEEARRKLMSIPGVGSKTADILLLMYYGKPTFPVDTHIKRVSRRLGLVDSRADYEEIRRKLMEIFNPEDYLEAHLRLIMLGRKYCKAGKPNCSLCPLNDMCSVGRGIVNCRV